MLYRVHIAWVGFKLIMLVLIGTDQGRIQDFKLGGGGGGGGALKKIAPSRGRRENFWGISCEKSRFYAKKSNFYNFRGGARNFLGISCEKSRFYAKKIIFLPILGGARAGCPPPPPLNPPLLIAYVVINPTTIQSRPRRPQLKIYARYAI